MGKVFDALNKAGNVESRAPEDTIPEAGELQNCPRAPDEPAQAISLSAVADEPQVVAPQSAAENNQRRQEGGKRRPLANPQGSWDERLSQAVSVIGPVAESIRTLRSRIMHPLEGVPPRTLLVTSATPGEGKSFITANLGISLAQGVDHHCLMVDCDLRRPSLHSLFGLPNTRGLAEHLRDRLGLEELLVKTGTDKLSLLPAGPPPVNPSELLSSDSMRGLVDELTVRYEDRIIILDSPPLQAASETAILAQQVDGVVLVVRWGGSRREHVQKLIEIIGKEHILGIVFNAYRSTTLDTKVFGYYEYQDNYRYER